MQFDVVTEFGSSYQSDGRYPFATEMLVHGGCEIHIPFVFLGVMYEKDIQTCYQGD